MHDKKTDKNESTLSNEKLKEIFVDDYINKIIMLEEKVGAKTKYLILNPSELTPFTTGFTLNENVSESINVTEIQKLAKKIGNFAGLTDLLFIIYYATIDGNVGGRIELDIHSKEVYIEISNNTAKFSKCSNGYIST